MHEVVVMLQEQLGDVPEAIRHAGTGGEVEDVEDLAGLHVLGLLDCRILKESMSRVLAQVSRSA